MVHSVQMQEDNLVIQSHQASIDLHQASLDQLRHEIARQDWVSRSIKKPVIGVTSLIDDRTVKKSALRSKRYHPLLRFIAGERRRRGEPPSASRLPCSSQGSLSQQRLRARVSRRELEAIGCNSSVSVNVGLRYVCSRKTRSGRFYS
jgi:hypothetical protein